MNEDNRDESGNTCEENSDYGIEPGFSAPGELLFCGDEIKKKAGNPARQLEDGVPPNRHGSEGSKVCKCENVSLLKVLKEVKLDHDNTPFQDDDWEVGQDGLWFSAVNSEEIDQDKRFESNTLSKDEEESLVEHENYGLPLSGEVREDTELMYTRMKTSSLKSRTTDVNGNDVKNQSNHMPNDCEWSGTQNNSESLVINKYSPPAHTVKLRLNGEKVTNYLGSFKTTLKSCVSNDNTLGDDEVEEVVEVPTTKLRPSIANKRPIAIKESSTNARKPNNDIDNLEMLTSKTKVNQPYHPGRLEKKTKNGKWNLRDCPVSLRSQPTFLDFKHLVDIDTPPNTAFTGSDQLPSTDNVERGILDINRELTPFLRVEDVVDFDCLVSNDEVGKWVAILNGTSPSIPPNTDKTKQMFLVREKQPGTSVDSTFKSKITLKRRFSPNGSDLSTMTLGHEPCWRNSRNYCAKYANEFDCTTNNVCFINGNKKRKVNTDFDQFSEITFMLQNSSTRVCPDVVNNVHFSLREERELKESTVASYGDANMPDFLLHKLPEKPIVSLMELNSTYNSNNAISPCAPDPYDNLHKEVLNELFHGIYSTGINEDEYAGVPRNPTWDSKFFSQHFNRTFVPESETSTYPNLGKPEKAQLNSEDQLGFTTGKWSITYPATSELPEHAKVSVLGKTVNNESETPEPSGANEHLDGGNVLDSNDKSSMVNKYTYGNMGHFSRAQEEQTMPLENGSSDAVNTFDASPGAALTDLVPCLKNVESHAPSTLKIQKKKLGCKILWLRKKRAVTFNRQMKCIVNIDINPPSSQDKTPKKEIRQRATTNRKLIGKNLESLPSRICNAVFLKPKEEIHEVPSICQNSSLTLLGRICNAVTGVPVVDLRSPSTNDIG